MLGRQQGEADVAGGEVDVGVADRGPEDDPGRAQGVVGRDLEREQPEAAGVGRLRRPLQHRLPPQQVRVRRRAQVLHHRPVRRLRVRRHLLHQPFRRRRRGRAGFVEAGVRRGVGFGHRKGGGGVVGPGGGWF